MEETRGELGFVANHISRVLHCVAEACEAEMTLPQQLDELVATARLAQTRGQLRHGACDSSRRQARETRPRNDEQRLVQRG